LLFCGLLFWIIIPNSFASSISCVGTDGEDSTYTANVTLTTDNQIDTGVGIFIRKIATNGFQFDWSMMPKYSSFTQNQSISSQGPFNGGQMVINATYQPSGSNYPGTMLSSGNSGGIVDIAITCTFQP
jgi:hypothetical protein